MLQFVNHEQCQIQVSRAFKLSSQLYKSKKREGAARPEDCPVLTMSLPLPQYRQPTSFVIWSQCFFPFSSVFFTATMHPCARNAPQTPSKCSFDLGLRFGVAADTRQSAKYIDDAREMIVSLTIVWDYLLSSLVRICFTDAHRILSTSYEHTIREVERHEQTTTYSELVLLPTDMRHGSLAMHSI